MQRQIKFRGKRVDNGEWVYGDLVINHCYGVSIVEEIYHVDGAEYNVKDHQVIPETVGQFTGLTDKNGKEIYEDDLMRSNKGVVYRVIWSDEVAKWSVVTPNVFNSSKYKNIFKSLPYAVERCVVIGSFHDNPEILAHIK